MTIRSSSLAAIVLAILATAASHAADGAVPEVPDAPGELTRGPGYPGFLALHKFADVTVVYPAGAGQDAATNRRSAEARARFLESVHGVATRVVADVDATEADRRGHLLVLGWNNAILVSKTIPPAFERRSGTIHLLGETVGDPGDDLLLFNRSPFAKDRYLVFWSRIDPERDRFMVLPSVGSDWAIVRDFRTIRQGMFKPGGAWPPVRDGAAEGDHEARLAQLEGTFSVVSSEHFAVHHEADRVPRAEVQAILKAREAALAKAAGALGAPPAGFRIDLWVYEDEGAKKDATGVPDISHALPRTREIHTTRRAARTASARDETHVLARARIGPSFLTAIHEGLGIAVDGSWRGRDLDLEAALITDAGRLPALNDLLDEERFRRSIDGPGLPAAGLFMAWLRATQPAPVVARMYGLVDASPAAVAKALGRSATDAEADFRGWVAERAAFRSVDLAVVKEEAAAKDRLAAGDYAGVAAALERAQALKPQDPQILFNLASALMRTERLEDAIASFRKVLALPLKPSESRFRLFSHYQIGRVLDILGKRDEALASYRRVLELPDEFDAHRLAAERLETPATRDQLE